MTRRITAHKGGRTARAPEARIRPQTLQRIRATMQQRDKSFADLLEESYGGNEMKYAIQTKTAKQANDIAATLTSVMFSDEDDTMFEATLTKEQAEALRQDNRVEYLSEL